MKIFNTLILTILFFGTSIQLFPANDSPFGDMSNLEKMPPLSSEDIEEMMNELAKLDPETLDALAKIGEDFIKEAEAQGKDPFELLGIPLPDELKDARQPQEEKPAEPETPVVQQPKPVEMPKPLCAEARQCRQLLKRIADLIAAIKLKAENDRKISEAIKPWRYHLDDIVYFTHILAQENLLKYVTDKEFEKLYKGYAQLEQELGYLEPQLVTPETTLETVNPYTLLGTSTDASWQEVNTAYQKIYKEKHPDVIKAQLKQKGTAEQQFKDEIADAYEQFDKISDAYNTILQSEQTKQVLSSILDSFSKAVYVNDIIGLSKKVLEKYEPEALKLKQEQEEQEKRARKEQDEILRRRSPYTPPVFEPIAPSAPISSNGNGFSGGGVQPSVPDSDATSAKPGFTPTKPGETKKPGAPGQSKPKGNGDKTKEDKEDKAKKGDGKQKPEPSHRVKKKTGAIQKDFEAIATEIDEPSPAPDNYPPGENLFKDFNDYLKEAFDYSKENDEKKAKGVNKRLLNITNKLRDINLKIDEKENKDLSRQEKKELLDETKKLYNQYFDRDKGSHYKKVKSLISLSLKEVKEDDKKYYHLDTDKVLASDIKKNIFFKPDEKYMASLSEGQKKIINGVRLNAGPDYDILNTFLDNFHKLRLKAAK